VLKLGEQLKIGRIKLSATSDATANNNIRKVVNQFYNIAMTEKDKYHDNPSGQ
jgi:hypothetical protein